MLEDVLLKARQMAQEDTTGKRQDMNTNINRTSLMLLIHVSNTI